MPYQEGDRPGSIRLALASNNGQRMDGHFGSCLRFLVYQVAPAEARLIDVRSTLEAESSEDRNAFRAALIDDCQVLFVISIGGPAAAKVIKSGIYPMKQVEEAEASEIITRFQTMLGGKPPPWLAKIMGLAPRARVRFDTDDAWED